MYEGQVADTTTLKTVFNSNLGYARLPFPVVPAEEPGMIRLNLDARFFYEDMPYGLCILKNIGQLVGVKTPHMDKQILWH